jgi:hypothetical protein
VVTSGVLSEEAERGGWLTGGLVDLYNLPFPHTPLSPSVVNLVFTLTNRPRSFVFREHIDYLKTPLLLTRP